MSHVKGNCFVGFDDAVPQNIGGQLEGRGISGDSHQTVVSDVGPTAGSPDSPSQAAVVSQRGTAQTIIAHAYFAGAVAAGSGIGVDVVGGYGRVVCIGARGAGLVHRGCARNGRNGAQVCRSALTGWVSQIGGEGYPPAVGQAHAGRGLSHAEGKGLVRF